MSRLLCILFILLSSMIFSQDQPDLETIPELENDSKVVKQKEPESPPVQKESIVEESFFKLEDNIVITASRRKENLQNAPASVIIISEEDIKNRGYTSIDEILYDLPGFDLSFSNGIPYIMGYQRGYRTPFMSRTLFMIDSKVQNDQYTQEAELSRQIPMTNIKRIEILYGPSSAVYGPNAFQGIINIITHDGTGNEKTSESKNYSSSKISIQGGSYNTRSIDAGIHGRIGEWKLAASAKVFSSNEPNLSNRGGFNNDYQYGNINSWGSIIYNQNNGKALSQYYDPSKDQGVIASVEKGGLKIGIIAHDRNEAYGVNYPGDRAQNNVMWDVSSNQIFTEYNNLVSSKLSTYTLLSLRETRFQGQWIEATPDWVKGNERYSYISDTYWGNQNKNYLFNHNIDYKVTDSFQISTGVKFAYRALTKQYDIPGYWPPAYNSWNRYEGKEGLDLTPIFPNGAAVQYSKDPLYIKVPEGKKNIPNDNLLQVYDMGGFAIATYEIGKFRFSPGLRYDKNSIYGFSTNPRATAIYKYNRTGAIKLLYGEAFQEPAFILLYGGWSGRTPNSTLKPEKERTTELILMEQFSNVLSEISIYYSRYENVLKETAKNDGGRKIYGMELRNKILFKNPIPNSSKLDIFFYYTYTEALSSTYYNFNAPTTAWTPKGVNPVDWVSGTTVLGKWENEFYTANPDTPPLPRKTQYKTLGDISNHKISMGINLPIQSHLNINLRAQYVGPRQLYLSNALRDSGPALQRDKGIILDNYFLLNGSFSLNLKFATIVLKIFNMLNHSYTHPGQQAANAGNNYYERSLGFYNSLLAQPGRYYMFSLNLEF